MYELVIDVDSRVVDNVEKQQQQALDNLTIEIQRTVIPASQQRTDNTINREAPPVRRPIEWASDAQRRFVMYWLRSNNNLPYKRTGRVRSWRVVLVATATGGEIRAENAVPYARFVYQPPHQQRMHRGTWQDSRTYADAENKALVSDVRGAWTRANRRLTG